MTARLAGLLNIVLGIILWLGHPEVLMAHLTVGMLFVLALWCLAGLGMRCGVQMGLVVRAFVWGLLVLLFGMVQRQMLVGAPHVYVRVLHLVIGLVAIGVAEVLGGRLRTARDRVVVPSS